MNGLQAPVEIAGAGPAGLAAAIALARAGRRVTVHERRPGVGQRFHDDFQGLENWTTGSDALDELATFGVVPTFEHTPFRETVAFDPSGREHRYRSARPFFYLVRRGREPGTLDTSLRAQAEHLGVEIRFRSPREQLPNGGIVAHGPHGSDAIAVGRIFDTDAADGAYAAVAERLAPEGYSYLLIVNGRGTVAACMFNDFHNERTYLERTIDFFRARVGFTMRNVRRFGGTGNMQVPETARRGALLYVGEAAGFQDPLWGFGMRYAMVSGGLAAAALLSGHPERYDALWNARLGGLMRAGVVNRVAYARLGDWGYRRLTRGLARAHDPRAWLGRRYGWSLMKGALYPWARRAYASSRRATFCTKEGCDCTWCRCQHAADSTREEADHALVE